MLNDLDFFTERLTSDVSALAKELLDFADAKINERKGSACWPGKLRMKIESQALKNGRYDLAWIGRAISRDRLGITRTDGASALDTSTCKKCRRSIAASGRDLQQD